MSDKTKCTETRGDTSPLIPLASPSEGLSSDLVLRHEVIVRIVAIFEVDIDNP